MAPKAASDASPHSRMRQLLSNQPQWFIIEMARQFAAPDAALPSTPEGCETALEFMDLFSRTRSQEFVTSMLPLVRRKTLEALVWAFKWWSKSPNASKAANDRAMLVFADCRAMTVCQSWVHWTVTVDGHELLMHQF